MSGNFADSNVLLYLPDQRDAKADIAERLLETEVSISVQVLNEIVSVMRGKWRRTWDEVDDFLDLVRRLVRIHPLDEQTHDLGLLVAKRHKLSIYDSMIVAAALIADCDTLYSEDMHPGLLVDGRLRIVNPFA